MKRHHWTEAEEALMRRHYPDSDTADLATALGVTARQVLSKANAMGLHKTPAFRSEQRRQLMLANPDHGAHRHAFPKGHQPANKGVKRPGWAVGRMAEHQFKPGNRPITWVPIGSYRVTPDGVFERKFSDDPGPNTNRWKPVARLVWEQHVGPVPPGHIVVFRPGQRPERVDQVEAYVVERLECISRRENLRRNSHHQYGPEMSRLVQLRGVLTRVIRNREKKEAEHGQDQQ
jgi:hypothetical protein